MGRRRRKCAIYWRTSSAGHRHMQKGRHRMPRHKLSTLSTIMPPKGEAVRPEPGEHSSKQATKPASLRSSKRAHNLITRKALASPFHSE